MKSKFVVRSLLAAAGMCVSVLSAQGATVTVSDVDALANALAAAASGDVVEVADGTYSPSATLVVPSGVTLRAQNGLGRVVFTPAVGGEAPSPVVSATDKTCVIEGFVISNYVYSATGNVVFLGNGGQLVSCRVTRNTLFGSNVGGAVLCGKGAIVDGCVVDNNDAVRPVGGVRGSGGGTAAIGCPEAYNGSVTIKNTLVCGNAGGLYANSGAWTVSHCTIADNLNAPTSSILNNNKRSVTFTDCVLLFSSIPGKRELNGVSTEASKVTFVNCYCPGLSAVVPKAATGNLTSGDAKFVNPWSGDYHLEAGSVLIGAASDGGDIGCHAYDASYVPTHPVVDLAPGADLKAAVDAAAEGTVIRLAAGEYAITEMVAVDRPIRVTGAGRDKTILRADGSDHRTLKINHDRAQVDGVTVTGAKCSAIGGAVWIGSLGGGFVDGRVTGCVALAAQGTVAVGDGGVISGCVIDDNAYATKDGVIGTASGTAAVNIWKGDNERNVQGALVDHCLIVNNRGLSLYIINSNTPTKQNVIQSCTVVGQRGYPNVSVSRGGLFRKTIFLAATEKPFREIDSFSHYDKYALTVESCFYRAIGTTDLTTTDAWCVQADDPMFVNPRGGDYRLRAGSPCIGAAADGSDIGCYAYDASADATVPSVALTDGADLAAAVAAAADGTDIKLGAGVYTLSAGLVIDKPIRLVGASRDAVFVQPADGVDSSSFRLLTLAHPLARVEGVTLRGASGGAVLAESGGVMEDCRVTECLIGTKAVWGFAAYLEVGYMNRCLVDKNVVRGYDTSFVTVSSRLPSGFSRNVGLLENTLIQGNAMTDSTGATAKGRAVYVQRAGNGTSHGGIVRGVTVVGNTVAASLAATERANVADEIVNSIFWDAPASYDGTASGAISHCVLYSPDEAATTYATDCLTVDPQVRASGRLKASSPCIGAAKVLDFVASALDLAGNPRVSKRGTQDIGCLQFSGAAGMMLIVR